MWFVYFLTDVALQRSVNLMDSTNLGTHIIITIISNNNNNINNDEYDNNKRSAIT